MYRSAASQRGRRGARKGDATSFSNVEEAFPTAAIGVTAAPAYVQTVAGYDFFHVRS